MLSSKLMQTQNPACDHLYLLMSTMVANTTVVQKIAGIHFSGTLYPIFEAMISDTRTQSAATKGPAYAPICIFAFIRITITLSIAA